MEIATAFVTIRPETSGFESELAAALGGAPPVDVPVGADVEEAQGDIESLDGGDVEVEVGAVTDPAQAEIDSLDGGTVEVEVGANTDQARAQVDDLSGSIDSLAGSAGAGGGAIGGMTAELAGLAGASTVATAGIGGLVAGMVYSVGAAGEAEVASALLGNTLAQSGADAYLTADAVQALATEIQGYSGLSDEAIQDAARMLLSFANVRTEAAVTSGVFDRATRSVADIARFMGSDAVTAAGMLGRALDNPVTGVTALTRARVSFTEAEREAITAMAESGDIIGAQNALLTAVEGNVKGAAAAYGDTLVGETDKAKESIGDLAEVLGGEFLPALTEGAGGVAEYARALIDLENAVTGFAGGAVGEVQEFLTRGAVQSVPFFGPIINGLTQGEEAASGFGTVVGPLPDALMGTATASGAAADGTNRFADAAAAATAAVGGLDDRIQGYLTGVFRVPEAERALRESFAALETTLAQPARTADDVAVSLQGIVERTAALGTATGDMTGAVDAAVFGLAGLQAQGKLSAAEVAEVISQLESIPGNTEGNVATPGAETSRSQAQAVADALMGIPGDYVANIRVNTGRLYADVAGAAAALRSLRNIESTGRDVGASSASTVAPTQVTLVNQLDGQVLTERVFEIDRRMAMAEGYEPA